MKVWPLAEFLTDFTDSGTPVADADERGSDGASAPAPASAVPGPDLLAEQRRIGRQEGEELARAAACDEIAALRQESERRLADARDNWAREQADAMASSLAEAFRTLDQRLAGAVAGLLEHVLAEDARRRCVEAFAGVVDEMLATPDAVTVRGPDDLIDALRARLPEETRIRFEVSAGPEVRAIAGDTFVETKLGAWGELVRGELA